MAEMIEVSLDRFLPRISIGGFDRCWEWTGTKNNHGYGQVRIDRSCLKALVHRVMFELVTEKPIPEDLIVRHNCDNRSCCNPMHLELVGNIKSRKRWAHLP
jgi:hypothetical protein